MEKTGQVERENIDLKRAVESWQRAFEGARLRADEAVASQTRVESEVCGLKSEAAAAKRAMEEAVECRKKVERGVEWMRSLMSVRGASRQHVESGGWRGEGAGAREEEEDRYRERKDWQRWEGETRERERWEAGAAQCGAADADGGGSAVKLIGRGSYSRVYRVERRGVAYALKVIELTEGEPRGVWMVHDEFSAMQIVHRNICHAVHMWNKGGMVHMVLEMCGGGSLKDLIDEAGDMFNATGVNPLSNTRALCFALQSVVSALVECERRRIVHADLKPGNILLSGESAFRTRDEDMRDDNIFVDVEGRDISLKLTDFGSSHATTRSGGSILWRRGTYGYRAPEVMRVQRADMRCDVYSLGITLYEMAMLHLPWEDPRSEVRMVEWLDTNGNVVLDEGMFGGGGGDAERQSLRTIVNGMLETDPQQRPFASEVEQLMRRMGLWR